MTDQPLQWTYQLKNQELSDMTHPVWIEQYDTIFEGKPVGVHIRVGSHTQLKQNCDRLYFYAYTDNSKTDFIGLVTQTGIEPHIGPKGISPPIIPKFFKPLRPTGIIGIDPSEAPRLEDFIRQYKPVFESQRDLRETFAKYF